MLRFLAPAKINLTLEVLARRSDGYHGVRSVMVPLALADELLLEPSEGFGFSCDVPGLNDDDNLVVRAFRSLPEQPRVTVALHKRIPTQAGLGGGSSDAAAVLLAAMDGAFGPQPSFDWVATARALGSDVPFFLSRTGALVEGTGERVTPSGALPRWHVLIVKPPTAVSTAAAYAALDRLERPGRARGDSISLAMLVALQRESFHEVERLLHNDFGDSVAASEPRVAEGIEGLRRAGARNVVLAGSGSCLFTLAPDAATVEAIASRLDLPADFIRYPTRFADSPGWRGAA